MIQLEISRAASSGVDAFLAIAFAFFFTSPGGSVKGVMPKSSVRDMEWVWVS